MGTIKRRIERLEGPGAGEPLVVVIPARTSEQEGMLHYRMTCRDRLILEVWFGSCGLRGASAA